ncbi:gem-associated protein 8 isoform X2 [Eublepharis macularius]|uniref:Gem-associated protein 8 isoform X2 n=1 Tax=Eublepharis macularius TaxID=481883 RepID=A0AA97J0P8_EUBMA|nr:gem-associated protein 8 isoform X2 [Eublepharis macularius]
MIMVQYPQGVCIHHQCKFPQIMESSVSEDIGPWYSQKIYARYWTHYNQAMQWMHRHKIAYRRAMESFYQQSVCPSQNRSSRRYSDWDEDKPLREGPFSVYSQSGRRWHPPRPQLVSHKKNTAMERGSKAVNESEDDEAIEYDLSNMEITEELRQYFEQTERHREELRKQQQLEAEHHDLYVKADHDLHPSVGRSAQPPLEKPGERRLAEMKKLYGVGANKIQAMETTMQLGFDRNCDKKQPKYWPVIPLKL